MNRATSPTGWVLNPDGTLGWTWNPITGCLNHENGLCKGGGFPCYAFKLANGRLKPLYLANMNCPTSVDFRNGQYKPDADAYLDPFYPRFWEERLMPKELGNPFNASYSRIKPRGIFICDMGEIFGEWIPETWQANIFTTIASHPYDRFYLLTKQPQNLIKFSPFPENCWVGVTATNYDMFVDACGYLCAIKAKGGAKITFVSLEPLLSWDDTDQFCQFWFQHGGIDWLIIGAWTGTIEDSYKVTDNHPELLGQKMEYKSKVTVQPKIEWVKEIVEAADKAGIPVFLKDNLKPLYIAHTKAQGQICSDYILRQEMPK